MRPSGIQRFVCAALLGAALATPFGLTAQTWDARLSQLGSSGPGGWVLAAGGDAIWTTPASSSLDGAAQGVWSAFREADIAFLNLEVPLVDRGSPDPGRAAITRGPTSIVSELEWAGIDMVSIANNHTMDYGHPGLSSTTEALSRAGIRFSGAGPSIDRALAPGIVERSGLRVALVSVAMAPRIEPPSGAPAGPRAPGIAPIRGSTVRLADGRVVTAAREQDVSAMERAIVAAGIEADVVLVSLHMNWLNPIVAEADGEQLVARAAIDAGAAAVIGHGPTVLGGIEVYRDRPILYSLGKIVHHVDPAAYDFFPDVQRFVTRMLDDERYPESVVARLIFDGSGAVSRLELLPVEITQEGHPRLAEGEMADRILDRLESLSSPFETVVSRQGWFGLVELSR